jgi:hypothetical protein
MSWFLVLSPAISHPPQATTYLILELEKNPTETSRWPMASFAQCTFEMNRIILAGHSFTLQVILHASTLADGACVLFLAWGYCEWSCYEHSCAFLAVDNWYFSWVKA